MAFALSEHIRSLRKARGLTQEQLAEALGVTTGAVYKWESRLSLPELPMLVQLADFFDTSVDALIGYTIKDNRRDATLARLMDLRHAKDLRGVDEAERAVMRYPNCFAIVYQAAVMMQVFGLEQSDKALTARALELYERALLLTEQNTNSEISELTIHVAMAECDLMLGRKEKALETLERTEFSVITLLDKSGNAVMQYSLSDLRSVYDQYGLSGDDQMVVGGANDDVMKIVNGEMKPIEA